MSSSANRASEGPSRSSIDGTPGPSGPPPSRRRSIVRRIPPPLLFAFAILAGWLIDLGFPARIPPYPILTGLQVLLIVLAGLLAMGSLALFARRRTTVIPHGRPSSLVTGGTYRISRNPMYVGLTLLSLAVTAELRTVWPLAFLPLPLLVLQKIVIPMEEETLLRQFGGEYEAYKARVRRWL